MWTLDSLALLINRIKTRVESLVIPDALSDLTNDIGAMEFLGLEPITTTASDTPANWAALGSGYAVYNTAGMLNGQPNRYGFVVSYVQKVGNNYNVSQEWIPIGAARVYNRAGDTVSGWFGDGWVSIASKVANALTLGGAELPNSDIYDGSAAKTLSAYNLMNFGAASSILSSSADDTPTTWRTYGSGYTWFEGNASLLADLPISTTYGTLLQFRYGNIISQMFLPYSSSITPNQICYRIGNASTNTWVASFTPIAWHDRTVTFSDNAPSSTAEDTPSAWSARGPVYEYINNGTTLGYPSNIGHIVNYPTPGGTYISQLWICSADAGGAVYRRAGRTTSTTWAEAWEKLVFESEVVPKDDITNITASSLTASTAATGVYTRVGTISIPAAGIYVITARIRFSTNTSGYRRIMVSTNSAATATSAPALWSSGLDLTSAPLSGQFTTLSVTYPVTAGSADVGPIYLWVYQNSGSGLTLSSLTFRALRVK